MSSQTGQGGRVTDNSDCEENPPSAASIDAPHKSLNMWAVMPALLFSIFLPALDQTIIAVALPTIISDVGGGNGYSWVGTSYLLASASCMPFYGKLSDILGRKHMTAVAWILFLLGSALCGCARQLVSLAVARGIQGAGGGGIITLTMISIADITPLAKRGIYIGLVGTVWGMASVVGPTVGGTFTEKISWRWCFYIVSPSGAEAGPRISAVPSKNLPIGGLLALGTPLLLPSNNPSVRTNGAGPFTDFDFLGLFLAVASTASLLVGLQLGKSSWSALPTIALLVLGGILGSACVFNEAFTPKSPVIPPRLFKIRTAAAILAGAAIHGFAVFAGSYYIPVYFQVLGVSATRAGVRTMAFSLVSSVSGSIAGLISSTRVGYRPVIWASWLLMTTGYALMIMLDSRTPVALQILFVAIAGTGIGGLFQVPLIALHAALPRSDTATSSAAFMLIRLIGSSLGLSVGDTVFKDQVRTRTTHIQGFDPRDLDALAYDLNRLWKIQPPSTRDAVVEAFTRSLSITWMAIAALSGFGSLLSLAIGSHPLHETTSLPTHTHTPEASSSSGPFHRMPDDDGEAVTGRLSAP
ncbi:major facilitator superfamily domain-containing protein [Trametes elegans]|nr:major facilitator superfamily domain-containing protein [Trametes elegans]